VNPGLPHAKAALAARAAVRVVEVHGAAAVVVHAAALNVVLRVAPNAPAPEAENVPRGAQKRRRAPDAKRAAAGPVLAPREAQLKDAAEKPAAKVVAARRRQGSVAAVVLARVAARPRARDGVGKFPDRNTLSSRKAADCPAAFSFQC